MGGGRRERQTSRSPRPGCQAVPGRVSGLPAGIGAWEHGRLLIGTRLEGETHFTASPSFLPYLPSPPYSPPLNPPAFHRGPAGAQVLGSVCVVHGSDPEADSEEIMMLRDRGIIFLGCDCGFLAPRIPGTAY